MQSDKCCYKHALIEVHVIYKVVWKFEIQNDNVIIIIKTGSLIS